jgi:hypothetical protein
MDSEPVWMLWRREESLVPAGNLFQGEKRPEHESDHSPPLSAEVKRYIFTP